MLTAWAQGSSATQSWHLNPTINGSWLISAQGDPQCLFVHTSHCSFLRTNLWIYTNQSVPRAVLNFCWFIASSVVAAVYLPCEIFCLDVFIYPHFHVAVLLMIWKSENVNCQTQTLSSVCAKNYKGSLVGLQFLYHSVCHNCVNDVCDVTQVTLMPQRVMESVLWPTNDCAVCVFLHINLLRWSLHADNWKQSCGK